MAAYKCKMCGANLTLTEGVTVLECEYCGSTQTVPTANDEKKMIQFTRANNLRFKCEFDKAAGIYESIVADFPDEPEAYWGLVLCKYGIEYVDDPRTHKKIPTCHRTSVENVTEDSDYRKALENADPVAKSLYQEEAEQIETLCRSILEVSVKEEPYDIFICYKETDESGDRTLDSVLAQEVYDALVGKGYRVFFSRITLEDKLGTQYEPYIFAALNSAKVMLLICTDLEYVNSAWVKNEWSRFLQLINKGEKDKLFVPCFKGIDPGDLPREIPKIQAQDLGKLGAIQEIAHRIEKVLTKNQGQVKTATVQQMAPQSATVDSLLKRVFMFLADGSWKEAQSYCERVLDIDPENARAYLGKLMASQQVRKLEDLKNVAKPFDDNLDYNKILTFGDSELAQTLKEYVTYINERNEQIRKTNIYNNALNLMNSGNSFEDFQKAAEQFRSIFGFKNADALCENCLKRASESSNFALCAQAEALIDKCKHEFNSTTPNQNLKALILDCQALISQLKLVAGWKNANGIIDNLTKIVNWGEQYIRKRSENVFCFEKKNYEWNKITNSYVYNMDFGGIKLAIFFAGIICLVIGIISLLNTTGEGILSSIFRFNDVLFIAFGTIYGTVYIILAICLLHKNRSIHKINRTFFAYCQSSDYLSDIRTWVQKHKPDRFEKKLFRYAHHLQSCENYLKAYDILIAVNKSEAAKLYADHYKDFIPGLN